MAFRPIAAREPEHSPTSVVVPGYAEPFDPLAYGWDGTDLRRNITVGVMAAAARRARTAGGHPIGAVRAAMAEWDAKFPESAKAHRADILARLDLYDDSEPDPLAADNDPETQAPEEIPF